MSDSKTVLTSASRPSPNSASEALEVSAAAEPLGGQEVGERVAGHAADEVQGNQEERDEDDYRAGGIRRTEGLETRHDPREDWCVHRDQHDDDSDGRCHEPREDEVLGLRVSESQADGDSG